MLPIVKFGVASIALLFLACAQAAPNVFKDPLDVATPISVSAAREMLMSGKRTPGGRLVVLGRRGVILTSDDDGGSWKQSQVPVSTDLLALVFPTAQQGWAVGHGGVVLHTNDGGLTWERQVEGRTLPDLLVKHHQAAADAGSQSAKRELQEAQRFKEDGPGRPLLDVHFSDAQRGLVVGAYNLALRTEDGGKTWRPISELIDNPKGFHLYGIAQVGNALWIAGEQGLVLRQDLSSGRFERVPLPYAGTLFGIAGKAGEVVVFGLRGNAFRSRDDGKSWTRLETGARGHLSAGTYLTDGRLVLTSLAGELLEYRDGADRFVLLPVQQVMPLYGVGAVNDGKLLLTGARGVRVQTLAAYGTGGDQVNTAAQAIPVSRHGTAEAK